MAYTSLSIIGTPGKPHSFSAKTEAVAVSGPHTGLFTELSVAALPGPRHSFVAKTAAGAASGPHTGLFTALSVMGLPGGIHSFVAKSASTIAGRAYDPDAFYEEPGMRYQTWMAKLRQEDEEISALIMTIVKSGMLN